MFPEVLEGPVERIRVVIPELEAPTTRSAIVARTG